MVLSKEKTSILDLARAIYHYGVNHSIFITPILDIVVLGDMDLELNFSVMQIMV